ncbi:MAG: hypothetical protein IT168_17205 [Bryobacterales bacterium]|nr:hypothetical protein [Bryobacterales bacterium]
MNRFVRFLLFGCWLASSLFATTLEHLTLDEMIQKSTAIVRGKILSCSALQRDTSIYTLVRVQVSEQLKGPQSAIVEVTLPGGKLNGVKQMFSGVPVLDQGAEYVLFLWTSPKGVTHVIGLSQGVLNLKVNAKGSAQIQRAAISDPMVDTKTGTLVAPDNVDMSLDALRLRVRRVLGGAQQ